MGFIFECGLQNTVNNVLVSEAAVAINWKTHDSMFVFHCWVISFLPQCKET